MLPPSSSQSILKKAALRSYETLVLVAHFTRRRIPEDVNDQHRCEKLLVRLCEELRSSALHLKCKKTECHVSCYH